MIEHVIVYSHGFGVRKDSRGMFTDIVSALPDATNVLFDYNQFDQTANTLTAIPLDQQAKKLQQVISQAIAIPKQNLSVLLCS